MPRTNHCWRLIAAAKARAPEGVKNGNKNVPVRFCLQGRVTHTGGSGPFPSSLVATFFHPDYTVGSGLGMTPSPDPPHYAGCGLESCAFGAWLPPPVEN